MGMNRTERGFALFVAVIFMSVMLALGLALSSLAYKQTLLSASGTQSQYAFYAADAALECALYADQQVTPSPFAYTGHNGGSFTCNGTPYALDTPDPCYDNNPLGACGATERKSHAQIPLDGGARCADLWAYKTQSQTAGSTYIFVQGYNVPCASLGSASARVVARGLEAHY